LKNKKARQLTPATSASCDGACAASCGVYDG
jgi:hypothetical protein